MADNTRIDDRSDGSDETDWKPNVIAMLCDTGCVGILSLEPLFDWLETRENAR